MPQTTNTRAALLTQRVAAWNRAHPHQQIDLQAELAVASQEGLSGGIGDGGHAFGPNQMNDAGGVLTGKLRGLTPEQKNAWAWTPKGIDQALSGVAGAAGGLHGDAAVRAIVSRYERPRDPEGEIARALAGLGGAASSQTSSLPAPAAAGNTTADPRGALVRALSGATSSGDYSGFYGKLGAALGASRAASAPGAAATAAPSPPYAGGTLAELLHEGVGGPTHSTGEHIHVALTDPQAMLAAIRHAQQMGLSVRENPYTDPVDPVHAPNSWHKQTFDGTYDGKRLGKAEDVSGDRNAMSAYEHWVRQTFGRKR